MHKIKPVRSGTDRNFPGRETSCSNYYLDYPEVLLGKQVLNQDTELWSKLQIYRKLRK